MAYLFCRCTRSVSKPPPTYYAHLAAFRGRIMLAGLDMSDEASTVTRGSGASGEMQVRAHTPSLLQRICSPQLRLVQGIFAHERRRTSSGQPHFVTLG